jgi:tetratricopeptide (TPR) repeat protein
VLAAAEEEAAGGAALPPGVRAAIELSRGELSWQQGEPGAAEAAVSRALALLSAESPSAARDLAMARADALLGHIAVHRGDHVQAEERLRRSLALWERVGDQAGIAATWSNLGWVTNERGALAEAEACFQRSLAIMERIGDQEGIAHAWNGLGSVANERGALAEAEACFQRSLAVMERIEDYRGVADSCRSLAWVAYNRGALAEAEANFRRELDLREKLDGHPGGIAGAWNGLGWVACERGELTAAATWCRRARRLARRSDLPWVEADASLGQACAYLRGVPSRGRWHCATVLLAHGRTLATAHAWTLLAAQAALLGAELQLRGLAVDQGALCAAQASAEEALRLAIGGQMRREEAVARRLLGQCVLCRGAADEAMEHLRAALARQREMGADLEAARTRLVLAEALATGAERGSSREEADTLLAEAETQFTRSGAALDLAAAEQVTTTRRQGAAGSKRDGCDK